MIAELTTPIGLPTTYAARMPSVIGEMNARSTSPALTWIPALASANSGTTAKLVHGWSRCWRRSLSEIADATPRWVERASSGVGRSRNDLVSSTARASLPLRGKCALVRRPTASPHTTGSSRDS
jgi:hypothetical protein